MSISQKKFNKIRKNLNKGLPAVTDLNPFMFTVKTDNTATGSSNADQFKLPTVSTGTYDMTVYWGDGSSDDITAYNDAAITHTYASAGTYLIQIVGTCRGWQFNNGGDKLKILDIKRWGILNISTNNSFYGCTNLTSSAMDTPTISSTRLDSTFRYCVNYNGFMRYWDVSNVTNMYGMFSGCSSFNQSIDLWNVSKVNNFSLFLYGCSVFNKYIGDWNVGAATQMASFFQGCTAYNQSMKNWNVSKVTRMDQMFTSAVAFNQVIRDWDVSQVTDFSSMFNNATAFNSDITAWNVISATRMTSMFADAINFNQKIGGWNVSNVTQMDQMFIGCASFAQDLKEWDVSNVTTMKKMFALSDIGNNTVFEGAIGKWNVGSVTDMEKMFWYTNNWNADLSNWDINQVSNFSNFLTGQTLSTVYYDALLISWAAQAPQSGITIDFGNSQYSAGGAAEAARSVLINTYGWTISDGGPV